MGVAALRGSRGKLWILDDRGRKPANGYTGRTKRVTIREEKAED